MFYIEEYDIYKICDAWTSRDWAEIDWNDIAETWTEDVKEDLKQDKKKEEAVNNAQV